jgi:two-component system, OmpR family, phosphate regulon response regulator OmpR
VSQSAGSPLHEKRFGDQMLRGDVANGRRCCKMLQGRAAATACNIYCLRKIVRLWDERIMATPHRIIVVDDDAELRGQLQRFLSEHGFAVRTAAGGAELDRLLAREPADAIVLDLMMPEPDGLTICRNLRARGDDMPILMLTARGDPMDRILGLEMGADDYLPKPFTPRELVARLSAILRRAGPRASMPADSVMRFGPFELNNSKMELLRDGVAVTLSSREFGLLAALAASAGRPLSRAQLIDRALGRDAEVTDRAIDVQINRLRRALGDDPADPQWIKTVWGVGYMLVADLSC